MAMATVEITMKQTRPIAHLRLAWLFGITLKHPRSPEV
jgi:hypothetical protein